MPRRIAGPVDTDFASAKMPLERATARKELARFTVDDRPEVAIAEASAAFNELAAARRGPHRRQDVH